MITISQMGKLRHKTFRPLTQCHPDTVWRVRDEIHICLLYNCPVTLCHLRVVALGGMGEHGQVGLRSAALGLGGLC